MKPPQKNLALKLSTLVVVTACFIVMGTSLLISQNFKNILTMWGEDVQMTVYLSQDISEQGRKSLEDFLKNTGKVNTVTYINQERALGDFRTQLASYAPDISRDDELLKLIPSSLQVTLASNVQTKDQMQVLQSLAADLKGKEGVDEVSFGQDWVEKYGALVSAMEITMELLGVVILAASLFVMSNAIRASVQNRKDEIVVLEMIGATSSMIRTPFLKEGALLGFISSTLAVILCFVSYTGFRNLLVSKLSFLQLGQHLAFITPTSIALLIIGGTAVGAFGSYLCVRKINDGWAASQG
ncbi:MAG TPA: permease-like cell division protein FtsX [Bdellovibrio sp.]|uniref:cell division protein FtsX n=1 Tax=Bdellovibrio sp. TaxID=28201 RepID=UPI002EE5BA39